VQVDNGTGTVTTDVSDQVLSVSQRGSRGKVTITIPDLDSIDVTDGSNLVATGKTDSYKITLTSGSNVDAKDLAAKQVSVDFTDGSNASISASDTVDGKLNNGSNLTVSGGGNTSGLQLNDGSNVSTG